MCVQSTEGSSLHQHGDGQQHAEEQSATGASRPIGGLVGAQEGGLFDPLLALAVPQVSTNTGGVAHGVGQVALLLNALEEVRHGPAGQHDYVFTAVRGGLGGDGGQLNVVFALWKQKRGNISVRRFKLVHTLELIQLY